MLLPRNSQLVYTGKKGRYYNFDYLPPKGLFG